MDFTPEDFLRQLPTPPEGWKWSGWDENGKSKIEIDGCLIGVKWGQVSLVDGAKACLHLVISENPNAWVYDWPKTEQGGLVAYTKGGGHCRQIHCDLGLLGLARREHDEQINRLKAAVGRRIRLHGEIERVNFADDPDDLFNFRGFDVGIQCMLCRPTHIYIEPSRWEKLKDYFGFA